MKMPAEELHPSTRCQNHAPQGDSRVQCAAFEHVFEMAFLFNVPLLCDWPWPSSLIRVVSFLIVRSHTQI